MSNLGFRRLGRTGLQVSEIGLGTVELGLEYGIAVERTKRLPSRDEAAQVLNQALDSGINYIDTARAYGVSEEIIGWALKSRRKEYILASKVGGRGCANEGDGSLRTHVTSSVRQSLQALQTDVIDLMQLHSVSAEEIRRGEMADILQEIQKAGSIRFLGATTYGEEAALAALEDGRYDCIQIAYNVLDREPETRVLPLAQSKNVGGGGPIGAPQGRPDAPISVPAGGIGGAEISGGKESAPSPRRDHGVCRNSPIDLCWPIPRFRPLWWERLWLRS